MRLKLYMLMLFNVLRITFMRLLYRKRFKARMVQRISPWASLELHEQGKLQLGYNLCVSRGCLLQALGKGKMILGDRVFFNRGCIISCQQEITIGDGCIFGPDVKIYDNDHQFSKDGVDLTRQKLGTIIIGEGTWVAANVVILRNTQIGKGCVIGAGAVVKGTIPDHSIVTVEKTLTIAPLK